MSLPNGPQAPSFVQMFLWTVSPISFMENCAKTYGDIFAIRLSSKDIPFLVVSHPEAVQKIFTSDTKELEAPGDLNKPFEDAIGKNSILSLSGKKHRSQRRLLMPPFHGERMLNYSQGISETTQRVINQYQINQVFNLRSLTRDITLQVMMQALFGSNESQWSLELQQCLIETHEKNVSLWRSAGVLVPALKKVPGISYLWEEQILRRQKSAQLIYQEIQERRENPNPLHTDILSLLMAARDEAGQPMSDPELHDEFNHFLLANFESTATALAWAFYWIHKIPSVRVKLLEELDSLEANADYTTISKLPYLNAVCSETLRIHPVDMFAMPRRVKTPISLCGYELPADTILVVSIYLTHYRKDLYPEPNLFRPERFLEKEFSSFEYFPFGGGARRCIGAAFAQLQMKLAIVKILSNYELELITAKEVKPKRRGFVSGPDRPIEMKIKGRRRLKSPALV